MKPIRPTTSPRPVISEQSRTTSEDVLILLDARRVTTQRLKLSTKSSTAPTPPPISPRRQRTLSSNHSYTFPPSSPSSPSTGSTSSMSTPRGAQDDDENERSGEGGGGGGGSIRLKKASNIGNTTPTPTSSNSTPLRSSTNQSTTSFNNIPSPGTQMESINRKESKDELQLLMISSSLTEFSMSIQECQTLIFEIQELRHTSSPMTKSSSTSSESQSSDPSGAGEITAGENPSQVDSALMELDRKLEAVTLEFSQLKSQIESQVERDPFIRRKWNEVVGEWELTQKDAESLGDELKEDKWLTVFRTVSSQAEDMMTSLEKVLKQSHEFIWGLQRRPSKSSSSSSASTSTIPFHLNLTDPSQIQPLLTSFIALHRSLHAKIKYYSPACDRVLKILGKGISDRSTKNGEVLRRFGEMKVRWRNLGERIVRIESEMRGVEEVLRSAGEGSNGVEDGAGGEGEAKRGVFGKLRDKMSGRQTPSSSSSSPPASGRYSSPSRQPQLTTPKTTMGNKLGSSAGTPPSSSPSRPPRNERRLDQPNASSSNLAISSSSAPITSHRYTQSATLSPPPPSSYRRAISPSPSADGYAAKPRWNISTKRVEEKETLRSPSGSRRPSLANSGLGRSITPGGGQGLRSSSRMSGIGGKAASNSGRVSPSVSNSGYSEVSSSWTTGGGRDRPSTPSRIPVFGTRRSTTPFSSLEDPDNTSLLQRTMTPTPSTHHHTSSNTSTLTSSTATTQRSRLPLPSPNLLSPPRGGGAASPTPSSLSSSHHYYRNTQTPEPRLIAQAQKMYNIRPPPVPSLPTNLRASTSTPRPSRRTSVAPSSRPPSSMTSSTSRFGASSPFPGGSSNAGGELGEPQPYKSNPLDPLDKGIANVVNSLPILLDVFRVDQPLARELMGQDGAGQSARYFIGVNGGAQSDRSKIVMCKIVDRVGPYAGKGEKKILVRIKGGWMDLEQYCLNVLDVGLR